jgi:hypothetical protein
MVGSTFNYVLKTFIFQQYWIFKVVRYSFYSFFKIPAFIFKQLILLCGEYLRYYDAPSGESEKVPLA